MPFVTIDPPDAKDHDDAVHARARSRSAQSRRPYRQRRHRRRGALRAARLGARPRGGQARQFGLFSRPRRADAAGAHFQRSVLAAPARRPPRARRAHGDRRRRPQALAHISPRADPLGGEAALRAGAARGLRPHRRGHRADRGESPRAALRRLSDRAARARDERGPLDLDLPGTQDRAQIRRHRRSRDHAAAARSAPADRGIHDPRQCRRRRDLRARACAADLSRARRAVAGKAQCAARVSGDARYFAAERRHAAAGRLQSHPRPRQRPRRRAAGQRSRAAHAGAGRIFVGKFRPFRPQSAPLRAFHLADPPLCRSRRASRFDPRRQARRRRPAGRHRRRARSPKSPPIFPQPSAAP